ncbi:MAG: hypothetical protein ABW175_03110 [Bradyrhizobium sp.]
MSDSGFPAPDSGKSQPGGGGCLAAFMLLIGIVLLLPGLCALLFGGASIFARHTDPGFVPFIIVGLLVGAGGVVLIRAAVRRFRR